MSTTLLIGIIIIIVVVIGGIYLLVRSPSVTTSPSPSVPLTVTPSFTPTPTKTPTPTGTSASQGETYPVTVQNFAFNPQTVTISVGDSVKWTNQDSVAHRIQFPNFRSADLNQGQSYSHTFTSKGTFPYICGIHPSMMGTVIVK